MGTKNALHLPDYVPPARSLSRASASSINRSATRLRDISLTLAGYDEVVPIVYGEDRISGLWLVRPYTHIGTGELRFAIAWCWGEIEGVQSIYPNGAAMPGSGVTVTHYTGTSTQTADATLAADIPGFNDDYKNLAYTVFRVDPGAITGFPQTAQIEAVVRGRKVYDPRTTTTAWTENPGLCLSDFLQSTLYGPGMTVYGTDAVADRCDTVIGGAEVRCKMGLTLKDPQPLESIVDLLATYAECLWSYDADGVLIVPDAPVDTPQFTLTTADIVEGSLQLRGQDLSSVPTSVTVTGRQSSGGADQWPEFTATQSLPGVDTGDIADIRSDVVLHGLRRESEGNRKALQRLRRLGYPGRYAWQAFDDGIKFQRGDVGTLPDTRGMTDRWVRILSIEMIAAGIYQITAEQYNANMYSDDYEPGSTATVPVGGILPYRGASIPAGWERFADADGKYLMGGTDLTHGDTGGADTVAGWSGDTSNGGGHSGTKGMKVYGTKGANSGSWYEIPYSQFTPPQAGSHKHGITVGQSATLTPHGRKMQWIKKTGTPGNIPVSAGVLADGELISSALTAVSDYLGRLAMSDAAGANYGNNAATASVTISPADDDHDHASTFYERSLSGDLSGPYENTYDYERGGQIHDHDGTAEITYTPNVKRAKLVHYEATAETLVEPGDIIGFDPAETLPAGWYLCDGTNGTPDLTDFFIEFSSVSNAGDTAGNNTASYIGYTGYDSPHDHRGEDRGYYKPYTEWWHGNSVNHRHLISGSRSFTPPYYKMMFIQYTGA